MNVCIKYKNESKDKLKEIDIKNLTCYYFYDVMEHDEYINVDRIS